MQNAGVPQGTGASCQMAGTNGCHSGRSWSRRTKEGRAWRGARGRKPGRPRCLLRHRGMQLCSAERQNRTARLHLMKVPLCQLSYLGWEVSSIPQYSALDTI
jgi:hypothetical protein